MTFQSCPEIAEYVIAATYDGQEVANVLHAKLPGGYSQGDINTLASVVDAWVGAHYLALMNAQVTYQETRVRGLTNIIDLSGVANANTGPGTASGGNLPGNVTVCVTFRSGLTGRSARGRAYSLPMESTAQANEATFKTTYTNALAAAFNQLFSDVSSAGWTPVVLSRRTAGALRTTGIGTPIVLAEVRNVVSDSQRGRLPKGH